MGAKSRTKGASGELEIVTLARELGFNRARRLAPMQCGYGQDYPDVDGVGPLWIESKRERKVASLAAYVREYLAERPGYVPVLAWREDRGEWTATLSLAELLKLVAKAYPQVEVGPTGDG